MVRIWSDSAEPNPARFGHIATVREKAHLGVLFIALPHGYAGIKRQVHVDPGGTIGTLLRST